jgi:hypothetical protein
MDLGDVRTLAGKRNADDAGLDEETAEMHGKVAAMEGLVTGDQDNEGSECSKFTICSNYKLG